MPWPRRRTAAQAGIELGFRSGLEKAVSLQLEEAGIPFEYEGTKLGFIWPARKATYTPDFLLPSGVFVETKGRLITSDRQKHILVRDQLPDTEIRFVFSNPNQRISKTSSTTYSMWAEKNGFQYAAKLIPESWLREKRKK